MGDATVWSYMYSVRRFHQVLDGGEPSQERAEEFVRRMEASGNSPRSIGRHIYALRAYFALPERTRVKALFQMAVLVYGGAGLRLAEGCALRREDIDSQGYGSLGDGDPGCRVT